MKLLIITQKVDINDPILGFFHRWIEEFAKNYEKITVICLEMGEYKLPENVKVFSLGKETGKSRFKYLWRFYKYIWQESKNYDKVFIHMNQEYVLLGRKSWWLLRKPVYLWRNHAYGSFWTRLAILYSRKVFYTSPSSYTARFNNAVEMPVGIDTDFFKPDSSVQRQPGSILFLGRIAPVKKVLEFIDWLKDQSFNFTTIAGSSLPSDSNYEKLVKEKVSQYGLDNKVRFVGAVTREEALKLYQTHETYTNFTPAGSFDKTILEAAACGMKLEVRNSGLKNFKVEDHSLKILMDKLKKEL